MTSSVIYYRTHAQQNEICFLIATWRYSDQKFGEKELPAIRVKIDQVVASC